LGSNQEKEGYLKAFYHKLLIKKGSKKALIAVGHKIIKATYHILKNNEQYKEPLLQIERLKERNKQKNIQKSVSQLVKLGFSVILTPTA
jgi:transposase